MSADERPPRPSRRGGVPARLITYSIVAVLAAVALRNTPSLEPPVPAAAVLDVRREPVWRQRVDTLAAGETLRELLERGGLGGRQAANALRAATTLDERRVPAGMAVTMRGLESDSIPTEVVFQLAVDRLIRLQRTDGAWTGAEEVLPWESDTIAVSGVIRSTLYEAFDSSAAALPRGARAELAWSLADIYEYRVDMSRDLQPGDAFRVLVRRDRGPQGAVRIGPILAAVFDLSGSRVEAVRHTTSGALGNYFDGEGKSMRAAFLRAPLAFRRISSIYGMRRHPILGVWRAHRGTDYAASSGTPVRSIGDGTVLYAGRKSGFGNVLEVRHRNGFVSRYGHLRGFARGVRRGSRVGIGQTIGFVGMTGLATAPHLHFEVLVGGVQRNPRVALAMKGGEPIPSRERGEFERVRGDLIALLDRTTPLTIAAAP